MSLRNETRYYPSANAPVNPVQSAMNRITGFPPIAPARPRILILGTMPSVESLERRQYYAHPRNAFWKIMGALLGFPADAPYRQRTTALSRSGIALWDLLHSCERSGSLDTSIVKTSQRLNDIARILRPPTSVAAVFLNGNKAKALFQRYLRMNSLQTEPPWNVCGLPSTSPANARMKFDQKLAAWQKILDYLETRT